MRLSSSFGPPAIFLFYGVSAAAFNAAFLLAILTGEVDVSPELARDPRAFWIYVVAIGVMTVGIDLWLLRLWLRTRRRKKDA